MAFSLVWLPQVLKDAGLKVALVPGWEDRGRGDMGSVFGVICHHTVGGRQGNMPSLQTLINGRKAKPPKKPLPGPLSQLGLGRDGTYYVIAAGRCNHAGEGLWRQLSNGNGNFIGIEAENTGGADDFPWPPVQLQAYHWGVAAILKHIGRGAEFCAGHKEYALPAGRKPDPSFDMVLFRAAVGTILNGTAPAPVLIPSVETGVPNGRPTLRRGAPNDAALVKTVQTKLGLEADGKFGPNTEAELRRFQRTHGLVPDGIVGPNTWKILDTV